MQSKSIVVSDVVIANFQVILLILTVLRINDLNMKAIALEDDYGYLGLG
jgi:hypothetical protein